LLNFHKNCGYLITDYFIPGNDYYDRYPKEIKEEWKKQFQGNLSGELEFLLGRKPRDQQDKDGSVAIYYS
jgi:hypothetical protein